LGTSHPATRNFTNALKRKRKEKTNIRKTAHPDYKPHIKALIPKQAGGRSPMEKVNVKINRPQGFIRCSESL